MTRRPITRLDRLNRRPLIERSSPTRDGANPPEPPARLPPAPARLPRLALAVLAGVATFAYSGVARTMENRAAQLRELLARVKSDPNPYTRFGW